MACVRVRGCLLEGHWPLLAPRCGVAGSRLSSFWDKPHRRPPSMMAPWALAATGVLLLAHADGCKVDLDCACALLPNPEHQHKYADNG